MLSMEALAQARAWAAMLDVKVGTFGECQFCKKSLGTSQRRRIYSPSRLSMEEPQRRM
jgi:hypothetical protein